VARAQPKTKQDREDDGPVAIFLESEAVEVVYRVPDMAPARREGKSTQHFVVRGASLSIQYRLHEELMSLVSPPSSE
jgi:hypothetical protein